jgi:hypothetical protein
MISSWCDNKDKLLQVKEKLSQKFEMKDLGDLHFFLGMEVVATLLWVKWEDETPTPKVRDLESSGTPECLELNRKAQNTLH